MSPRNRLLLLIPLLLAALLAGFILALPGFVSSARHRATIEALASSFTGRQVHINGKLSLALLPAPQLIAERITISGAASGLASGLAPGPATESITARSLTLNIAVSALLKGRLQAASITLVAPTINIPWPPPAGAQPDWLAALHAQIDNGRIMLGALAFTHVNADLFTGPGGAVSFAGSFLAGPHPLTLSVSRGPRDADGNAAVAINAQSSDFAATAHLSGALNAAGALAAGARFSATPAAGAEAVSGTANVAITISGIRAGQIRLAQGNARLGGALALTFAPELLTASFAGQNLQMAPWRGLLGIGAALPARLELTTSNASIGGVTLVSLHLQAQAGAAGVTLRRLDATLPGAAALTATGQLDPAGGIAGQLRLDTDDLPTLLAAYGGPANLPESWRAAHLTATIAGAAGNLSLRQIAGVVGADHLRGALVFTSGAGVAAAGQLHFDHLDLAAFPPVRAPPPVNPALSVDGEITADHASIGKITLNHLLLDGIWNGQFTIRRVSAAAAGGIAAASLNIAPGNMLAARGLITVPSAAPLLALLPPMFRPPPPLLQAPLTISLAARGPQTAFSVSAVATLGGFTVTTSPVIDWAALTAAGALTLRHPDAIAALASFGLNTGWTWPGAGSIGVSADFSAGPGKFALPNFVVSLGDLTASGSAGVSAGGKITADIDADTLALPPLAAPPPIPWAALAGATGTVKLSARRVLLAGAPLLGPGAATLTLKPGLLTLAVPSASLAGGAFSGELTAATGGGGPPRLAAKFSLVGAGAADIHPPFAPPFAPPATPPATSPATRPAGQLDATGDVTASGYTPAVWVATLAGPVTLSASHGAVSGFSLAGMAAALASAHRAAALRAALTGGATAYAKLEVSGNFQNGNFTIANAGMTGPAGAASATGSIDVADRALALNFSFAPAVAPPLTINMASIGDWRSPRQIPALADALNWRPMK